MSPHLSSEERGKRRKREGKGGMFPPTFEFRRGKEGKGEKGRKKGEKGGEKKGRKIINY